MKNTRLASLLLVTLSACAPLAGPAPTAEENAIVGAPASGPITGPVVGGTVLMDGVGKMVFRLYEGALDTWMTLAAGLLSDTTLSSTAGPSGPGVSTLTSMGIDLSSLTLDPLSTNDPAACKKAAVGNLKLSSDYKVQLGDISFAFDPGSQHIVATVNIDKISFSSSSFSMWTYIADSSWWYCILDPAACLITVSTCEHSSTCAGYYCKTGSGSLDGVTLSNLSITYTLAASLSSGGKLSLSNVSTAIGSGYSISGSSSIETWVLNEFKDLIVQQSWFDKVGTQVATIVGELYGLNSPSGYSESLPWTLTYMSYSTVSPKGFLTTKDTSTVTVSNTYAGMGSAYGEVDATVSYDLAPSSVRHDYAATTTLATSSSTYPYGTSVNSAVPDQLLAGAYEKGGFTVTSSAENTNSFRSVLPDLPGNQTFGYTLKATATPYVDFSSSSSPTLVYPAVTLDLSVAGVAVAEVKYIATVPLAASISSSGQIWLKPSNDSATVSSVSVVSQSGSLASTSSATFSAAFSTFLKKAFFHDPLALPKTGFATGMLTATSLFDSSCSSGWLNLYFQLAL